MIVLPQAWMEDLEGKDPFETLFAVKGEVYREQQARRTLRFSYRGKYYFGKFHSGVGWRQLCKDLLQLRMPVLGAQNEWRAIRRLTELGIPTTPLIGYGIHGRNPAKCRSFVITEELAHTVSLEDFCREWGKVPPDPALKRALIVKVAEIARILHESGMNHRDFYICHFLLDISRGAAGLDPRRLRLYLIDLHRVQIRRRTPARWRIKDLASLCFSSMDAGLSWRDRLRFVRIYRNRPLREVMAEERLFWRRVNRRAAALYREFQRKHLGPAQAGD